MLYSGLFFQCRKGSAMSVPRIVQIVFVVFLILTILLKWGFVLNLIAAVGAIGATIWERQSSK
jgi:hypothetical protein